MSSESQPCDASKNGISKNDPSENSTSKTEPSKRPKGSDNSEKNSPLSSESITRAITSDERKTLTLDREPLVNYLAERSDLCSDIRNWSESEHRTMDDWKPSDVLNAGSYSSGSIHTELGRSVQSPTKTDLLGLGSCAGVEAATPSPFIGFPSTQPIVSGVKGIWQLVHQKGFEEHLRLLQNKNPIVLDDIMTIEENDHVWMIENCCTLGRQTDYFRLGEEHVQKTLANRVVRTTTTFEGNKMVFRMADPENNLRDTRVEFVVDGDILRASVKMGNHESSLIFSRIVENSFKES